MVGFGTGGWRAVIGEDFTKTNVQRLAAALGRKMKEENCASGGVVIGFDRRVLSDVAARWAAEALAGESVLCRMIRRAGPAALLQHAMKQGEAAYGLMVTAGHNALPDSGIELFTAGGRDADRGVTDSLEAYVGGIDPESVRTVPFEEGLSRGMIEHINPFYEYMDDALAGLNTDALRGRRFHAALDLPAYGAGRELHTLLVGARCETELLLGWRGALFGGACPPGRREVSALCRCMEEGRFDIGIATDGDSDRLVIADDRGALLRPGELLTLLYYHLLKYKGMRGAVVRSTATTHMPDRVAHAFGECMYEVPVGFAQVASKMNETGALIGGEGAGGVSVRGHLPGRDTYFAVLLLLEMMAVSGRALSALRGELHDLYGESCIAERGFPVSRAEGAAALERLTAYKQLPVFPWEVEEVSVSDGCRVVFQNGGWLLVRQSGTEAMLRLVSEMPERVMAKETLRIMAEFLEL